MRRTYCEDEDGRWLPARRSEPYVVALLLAIQMQQPKGPK
jgi:hypothetical protein